MDNGLITPTRKLLAVGELRLNVLAMVQREATRAHAKHGNGSILAGERSLGYMLACGMEEIGEVAKAMVEEDPIEHIMEEWIQVANVGLSSVQAILQFGITK
jgi:hypothetical protein